MYTATRAICATYCGGGGLAEIQPTTETISCLFSLFSLFNRTVTSKTPLSIESPPNVTSYAQEAPLFPACLCLFQIVALAEKQGPMSKPTCEYSVTFIILHLLTH